MKSSQELAKEIKALQARVEAIVAIAKEESRDLNADEQSEVDGIVGSGENAGRISALVEQKNRMDKIDAHCTAIVKAEEAKETSITRRVPARAKAHGKLEAFKSEQDAYDCGQYVLANLFGNRRAKAYCKDNGIKAVMTGGDNTKGGFLVPEPMEAAIIELREQYGVFRQNSTVWPMSDSVTIVPKLAGEVTTYYVGENSTITASDATVQQVKLEAKKLASMTLVSSELNEDAVVSVAEMISRSVAYQFAVSEDQAGFLGDGTSTYGGIVGLAGALAAGSLVTATSLQTFSALTFASFESVVGACKMYAGIQPKWYIHQAGWAASMQRLANAAGGVTMAEIAGGMQPQFLGYPVVVTQVLTSALTGTSGLRACYFGDLRLGSYLGTRRGISIAVDSSRYFEQDSIAIKATQRYDINVHDRGTASASGGIIGLVFG
jgi:HK97 family phage major capsid protein